MQGGSVGKHHADKVCKLMDHAAHVGCPVISLIDSGGARINEGVHALAGYGALFKRNVQYSGVIPQISVILGPCAGGAVYSPALTDIIIAVRGISQLFITGPHVIKHVTGEVLTKEALGGTDIHSRKSGVIHYVAQHEEDAMHAIRKHSRFFPATIEVLLPQHLRQHPMKYHLQPLCQVVILYRMI